MRVLMLAILGAQLLLPAASLARSNYAPGSFDGRLRVEWAVVPGARGRVVEGFVYNTSGQATDRMRLSIERLDAGGRVVGESTVWVAGGVPPNNRAWFSAPVPEAAGYRVEILSFDWIGRGT